MESQTLLIYDESATGQRDPIARLKSCFVPRVGEYITVRDNNAVSQYMVKFVGYMADAETGVMLAAVYCGKLAGKEKTEEDNEE